MADNSQLSSILLLLCLVVVVYYLTRPNNVKNEGSVDGTNVVDASATVETNRTVNAANVQASNGSKHVTFANAENYTETNQEQVNSFAANDLNVVGASIDEAYQQPLPETVDSTAIDFNRNNVIEYDNKDYLPNEVNDEWFETDFSSAPNRVDDNNLVPIDRYVIGINTVGQSLKNASYDLRGTIPNPKFTISPWNNSTYEPDFNIKSLC